MVNLDFMNNDVVVFLCIHAFTSGGDDNIKI